MAIFTFYGDASGKKELDALVVSGFVSTLERWRDYEAQWRAHLDRFQITHPFHMTDFMNGHSQYKSWFENKERRREFLKGSVWLVKRFTNISFSSGMSIVDYKRACEKYPILKVRHPYTLCGLWVVESVRQWMNKKYPGEPCSYVFEDGDEGYGVLHNAMCKMGFPDPTREKKIDRLSFAPADILAWTHGKFYREFVSQRFEATSPLLDAVMKQFPREDGGWNFFNYENLESFCQRVQAAELLSDESTD